MATTEPGVKTTSIKLDPERHAQLVALATLDKGPLNDQIQRALAEYVDRRGASGDLAAQAQAMLADIDRDAEQRKQAVRALMRSATPSGKDKGRREAAASS